MRVELDLPDWTEQGQAVRIFAGIELVARKFQGRPWEMKTARCNLCGECCDLSIPGTDGVDPDTGYCRHLIDGDEPGKRICGLGANRPFSCCAYAAGTDEEGTCSIRWEPVD